MHPSLNKNLFLVKEHVGMLKVSHAFDVFDPATGEELMRCREENLGTLTKLFRLSNDYRHMTPFGLTVRSPEGEAILSVKRGITLFLSKVQVYDEENDLVGGFKQKLFSIGGAFKVLDAQGEPLCELKGKWTSWEFKFMAGDTVLAEVTKKWSGLGKELFTSADNYILRISEDVPPDHPSRQLILAAVFCIDLVLKE